MADPVPSLDELVDIGAAAYRRMGPNDDPPVIIARAILTAVLPRVVGAAVEAEREECAKVADNYAAHMRAAAARRFELGKPSTVAECKLDAGEYLAAAIRARTVSDQLRALGGG